eukprot:6510482-Pyramimonas_sp.AAC.1
MQSLPLRLFLSRWRTGGEVVRHAGAVPAPRGAKVRQPGDGAALDVYMSHARAESLGPLLRYNECPKTDHQNVLVMWGKFPGVAAGVRGRGDAKESFDLCNTHLGFHPLKCGGRGGISDGYVWLLVGEKG